MINEEKVILMTHASLYENGEGKKQMKIADYYRHDYISVRLLLGWFWGTVGFVAMLALWVFCKMECSMENLHNMDLKGICNYDRWAVCGSNGHILRIPLWSLFVPLSGG